MTWTCLKKKGTDYEHNHRLQAEHTQYAVRGWAVVTAAMASRYSIPASVGAPVVAGTLIECEMATAQLLKQAIERRSATKRCCTILGLDTEWDQDGKVALIQLATTDACVIIQVHMFARFLQPKQDQHPNTTCSSLRELLWRQDIIKVGSAIATDLLMLSTELGLPSRSFVDLQTIARWARRLAPLCPVIIGLGIHLGRARKMGGAHTALDCEAFVVLSW